MTVALLFGLTEKDAVKRKLIFYFLLIISGHAVYFLSYDRYMKFENNICNINRFENIDKPNKLC